MLTRLVLAAGLLLAMSGLAEAQAVQGAAERPSASLAAQMLAGSWALRVEGVVVFRFDLARNGEGWSGTWVKPRAFATDGAIFAELSGPPLAQKSLRGRSIGESAELTFGDARPGAIPDVFRFRLISPERAEAIYADTGQAPFVLERVDPATEPGPWPEDRVYRRSGVEPGTLVSYNLGPRAAASPTPAETERQPAIIGR